MPHIRDAPPAVVDSAAQLRAFVASRAFVSRQPLIVRIPGMADSEASAVSERLNTYRAECGCSLGARAMTAGFLISLGVLMSQYGVLTLALLVRLPLAIAAGVVFAIVGKVVGIATGRRRARREVARILTVFAD